MRLIDRILGIDRVWWWATAIFAGGALAALLFGAGGSDWLPCRMC